MQYTTFLSPCVKSCLKTGEDILGSEFLAPDSGDNFLRAECFALNPGHVFPGAGFLHPNMGQTFPGSEYFAPDSRDDFPRSEYLALDSRHISPGSEFLHPELGQDFPRAECFAPVWGLIFKRST